MVRPACAAGGRGAEREESRCVGRACDTFERGPVPFGEFLYRENRRLALEQPRQPELSKDTARPDVREMDACGEREARVEAGGDEPVKSRGSRGAVVVGASRPFVAARFIDLYA